MEDGFAHAAKSTRIVGTVAPGPVTRHAHSIASPSGSLAVAATWATLLREQESTPPDVAQVAPDAVAVGCGSRFTAWIVTVVSEVSRFGAPVGPSVTTSFTW